MKSIALFCLSALFALSANPVSADEAPNTKARTLDTADKEVKQTTVRDSMIGPRDTLVFYRFATQHAVLVLQIGNQSEKFPIKATVHLFAENATGEMLDKWINNQHSDGLFPDVPTPTSSHQLPEGTCKASSHEKTGRREHGPGGPAAFDDFKVKFKVDAFEQKGAFSLKAFSGEAGVLVKQVMH